MKYIRLFMVSFVLLCFLSISAMASEREAGAEEISRVKNGQAVAYNWEKSDGHWKLLYLDAKEKMWRYAKDRWVQIGSRFYYFLPDGNAAEGWFQLDGKWYFAEYDNKKGNKEDASVVLMGWASIPDQKGKYHSFYFMKDQNGRPGGMVQSSGSSFEPFSIEGQEVYFDNLGYADMRTVKTNVQKISGKRE